MKYFFLDTCIYVACSLINKEGARPDLLDSLFDNVKSHDAKLLLPDVVLHEYQRKVDVELGRLSTDIERFGAGAKTLAAAEDRRRLTEFLEMLKRERKQAAELARDFVERLPEEHEWVVGMALTPEIVTAAVVTSLKGMKPSWRARAVAEESRAAERGLIEVDCLIVNGLAEWARRVQLDGDDVILFCSDNHKDFARFNEDTKQHVIDPAIQELFPCPVVFHVRLGDMLQSEFGSDPSPPGRVAEMEKALGVMRQEDESLTVANRLYVVTQQRREAEERLDRVDGRLAGLRTVADAAHDAQDQAELIALSRESEGIRARLARLRLEQEDIERTLYHPFGDATWRQGYLIPEFGDPQGTLDNQPD